MDGIISALASAVPFVLLISVVITVHELGHYWVGRMFGAAVESFSVGFGRSILEVRDKRGTRWRINWLPLGGFVKFVGELQAPTDTRETPEAAPANATPQPRLVGKPYTDLGPMKRLAVSLGGPFANFVFAIVVFGFLGMAYGVPQSTQVTVNGVLSGSVAEAAGFKPGDVIVEAGGRPISVASDVNRVTELSAGEPVAYRLLRDGGEVTVTVTPKEVEETNPVLQMKQKVGRIGVQLDAQPTNLRNLNPVEAVGYGFSQTGDALNATLNVLRRLVTGKEGIDKLSGPVGIFTLADKVTDLHMKQKDVSLLEKMYQLFYSLAQLAALLSIGVGFFNLLPIPVLDGGAAVMCLAEAATGKEIPEKVQRVGLTIGLACLVSFALLITWQDISRLWPGGS